MRGRAGVARCEVGPAWFCVIESGNFPCHRWVSPAATKERSDATVAMIGVVSDDRVGAECADGEP